MVAGLLLLVSAVSFQVSSSSSDQLLAPTRVEASRDAEGETFESIRIDGRSGTTPWRRVRLTFRVGDAAEAGAWLLAIGHEAIAVRAKLGAEALGSAPDFYAADPRLTTGPRFTVAGERLAAGDVTFTLDFDGERGGRGIEQGPAWLASPQVATRAFAAAQVGALTIATANYASAGMMSKDDVPLERVLFKWSDADDAPRLAAQLDMALVDRERGGEAPLRSLATRKSNAIFPTSWANCEDPRFRSLRTQLTMSSPQLTTPLRLCDAKAVVFELAQNVLRESFLYTWNLRFLPNRGGPLVLTRGDGYVLLANECVGLVASAGAPIGVEGAYCGLAVELNSNSSNEIGALSSPTAVTVALIGFEPQGADPSQAESITDLAHSILSLRTEDRAATSLIASTLAFEPNVGGAQRGQAARKAAVATLFDARRRGGRYVFAPDGQSGSPAAYWGDTFTLLHHPNHERNAVERLLSTQDATGAVPGDLTAEASEVELAAADAYAVLRACRWFRWVCDGDRFAKMVPALEKALAHADGCDLSPGAPQGGITPLHAALARAAAHQQLAAALDEIALLPEHSASHAELAVRQLEPLFSNSSAGGRLESDGYPELVGGDAREAAVALALGLADDTTSLAIASQVAFGKRAVDVTDWRDALVARGLLECGRTKALARSIDGLENGWKEFEVPSGAGLASWHGVVVFGLLGARRVNLGTFELRPRVLDGQLVNSAIRLPEGALRFNIGLPNAQFERQVVVINDGKLDVLVRLGVPNGSNIGQRIKRGDLLHAFHDHVLMAKETWREILR